MSEDENFIVATVKSWNIENFNELKDKDKKNNYKLITNKEDLTLDLMKKINPKYIFFPHWSWKIPEEIYNNFECVVFHMTDLPFGRGGSPLQNLISRGIYDTKISAIKVVEDIDAGDIYCKEPVSIKDGSAEDIFNKVSSIIYDKMISFIIKNNPIPKKQKGELVVFKRRSPKDSDISKLDDVTKIYDYIRMLDAEGYPKARIETEKFNVEFSDAKIEGNKVTAKCEFKLKEGK